MGIFSLAVGFLCGAAVTYGLCSIEVLPVGKKKKDEKDDDVKSRGGISRSMMSSRSIGGNSSSAAHLNRDGLITDLIKETWPYINVAASQMIRESVEPSFAELPGPLSTLHFTKIDLGNVPIRMDNITVHEIEKGKVKISMDLAWDGTCDISLKADYIGSFGVKSIKLFGRLCFLLKPLENTIPPFAAIQYSFVAPPTIELDFTGLAQVADFAVIDKKIRAIIQDSFSSVVLPNRMLTKMDMAVDFLETYEPPVGVARVTLLRGRGFVEEVKALRANDVPDVYCNISMTSSRTWKTAVVQDSLTPVWTDETADFILSDLDQCLTIHAWDEDKGPLDSDDDLGVARVSFGDILLGGGTLEVELQQDDIGTGAFVTVHCDMLPFSNSLDSLKTAVPEPVNPNLLHGMLTVVVTKATGLPVKAADAESFVKVKYGDELEFLSAVVTEYPGIDAINPDYDLVCFVPLFAAHVLAKHEVVMELWNSTTVIGKVRVPYASVLKAKDHSVTKVDEVQGSRGCKLHYHMILQGVTTEPERIPHGSPEMQIPASPAKAGTGLGNVTVTVMKGWGFQVEKRMFKKDDIPDVYCKTQFGSSPTIWRTSTVRNSVAPTWNEKKTFKLLNHSQILNINVFDEDNGRNDEDDFLGSVRVAVGKILLAGGVLDVELLVKGQPTGCFVKLACDLTP